MADVVFWFVSLVCSSRDIQDYFLQYYLCCCSFMYVNFDLIALFQRHLWREALFFLCSHWLSPTRLHWYSPPPGGCQSTWACSTRLSLDPPSSSPWTFGEAPPTWTWPAPLSSIHRGSSLRPASAGRERDWPVS